MYSQPFHTVDITDKSFLVTGGAGFIGSHIVEYLLAHGAGKVRVLDNLETGKKENLSGFKNNPAFEWVEGDICDIDTCRKAVDGINYVSHQAALGSVPRSLKDPLRSNEVNVTGFLNMLVAARDAGVQQMVYAASSSTYGDSAELPKVENRIGKPLSPYAITKYVNELYGDIFARVYDFYPVGLRYFNIFGPRQDPNGAYAAVIPLFFKAALKSEPPVINGDGEQSRDFTFVVNAVEANIKAMLNVGQIKSHEVYNIAFGQNCTLNQLWQNIQTLTKKENVNAIYGPTRSGDVRHSLADIGKAKDLLGYKPGFSLEKGLGESLLWYKEQFYTKP